MIAPVETAPRSMHVIQILRLLYDLIGSKRAEVWAESQLATARELDDHEKSVHGLSEDKRLRHLAHMCQRAVALAGGSDAQRHQSTLDLGFIQGALWWAGISTLADLETMNRTTQSGALEVGEIETPVDVQASNPSDAPATVRRSFTTYDVDSKGAPAAPGFTRPMGVFVSKEPGRDLPALLTSKEERDALLQGLHRGRKGYMYQVDSDLLMRVVLDAQAAHASIPVEGILSPRQQKGFRAILLRIASWTNARFDQHLRHEISDEDADAVLRFLGKLCVLPPECDPSGRLAGTKVPVFTPVVREYSTRDTRRRLSSEGDSSNFSPLLERDDPHKMLSEVLRELYEIAEESEKITPAHAAATATQFRALARAVYTHAAVLGEISDLQAQRELTALTERTIAENSDALFSRLVSKLGEFAGAGTATRLLTSHSKPEGEPTVPELAGLTFALAALLQEVGDRDAKKIETLTAEVRRLEEYTGLRTDRERHQHEVCATTAVEKESP